MSAHHVMSSFEIRDFLIPLEAGHATTPGWPEESGARPHGVTWHWTATRDLIECRRLLGGPEAERRGLASAHFAIGRRFAEGVDRYVGLEDRSWHAGKNQLLRFDGAPFRGPEDKGARTTVGVETVNIGYARRGIASRPGWIPADSPSGRQRLRVQPWTAEQIEMAVLIGRLIQDRWPHLGPRDHHGHHDLCPAHKVDVSGFPFAEMLRRIYDDPNIPDVWTPLWTVRQRHRALIALGYDPGHPGGRWDDTSKAALRRYQRDAGLTEIGYWTTFVNWRVYENLAERGLDLAEVTAQS